MAVEKCHCCQEGKFFQGTLIRNIVYTYYSMGTALKPKYPQGLHSLFHFPDATHRVPRAENTL